MPIKYEEAEDLKQLAREIVEKLELSHVNIDNVAFLRSRGSSSRRTIARCHALSKPLQIGLKRKGFYLIEAISERFDKLNEKERVRVIIHELMHIPKCFGGGFKHHDYVCDRNIDLLYRRYIENPENLEFSDSLKI